MNVPIDEGKDAAFENEGEKVEVANFTLVKKYGKGKEYINCAAYGEKAGFARAGRAWIFSSTLW